MYLKNQISQPITRHDDDDVVKKLAGNKSGHKDTYTFDANKHYSSVLKFRKKSYILGTMWDTSEEFNETVHGGIPYGAYLLRQSNYYCPDTKMFFNHNLYSYTVIKELLHKNIITKSDIS
jgi:hypothetical protein